MILILGTTILGEIMHTIIVIICDFLLKFALKLSAKAHDVLASPSTEW